MTFDGDGDGGGEGGTAPADKDDLDGIIAEDATNTLRDDLEEAFKQDESGSGEGEAEPPVAGETPAATTAADKPAAETTSSAGQERGEDGRFITAKPKEGEAPAATTTAADKPALPATTEVKPAVAAAEPAAAGVAPAAPAAPATREAPETWTPAHREMFGKQTPEAQAFLLEREAAHAAANADSAPVRESLTKWQPYLDSIQAAPHLAIDYLFAAEYQLRTGTPEQKKAAIEKIVADYGIELGAAPATATAGGNGALPAVVEEGDQPYVDPAVKAAMDETAELRRTVQTLLQTNQQGQLDTANQQIGLFKEMKTEAGDPAYPFFDEVYPKMVRLAAGAKADGLPVPPLADLYEDAVWSTPAVREKRQAAEREAAQAKADADAAAAAKKAVKAGASVTGKSPTDAAPAATQTGGDLRKTIEDAYTEVESRV